MVNGDNERLKKEYELKMHDMRRKYESLIFTLQSQPPSNTECLKCSSLLLTNSQLLNKLKKFQKERGGSKENAVGKRMNAGRASKEIVQFNSGTLGDGTSLRVGKENGRVPKN